MIAQSKTFVRAFVITSRIHPFMPASMFALHYTNTTGMNTNEATVGLHFRCNSWLSTIYNYLRNLPLYKSSSSISF